MQLLLGRALGGDTILVADRVVAWYGKRSDRWKNRLFETLEKVASGAAERERSGAERVA